MKRNQRDTVPVSARNLRLDAGLSGAQVATRMGVSQSAITNLERRYGSPAASTVVRFLEAVERPDLADQVRSAARALAAVRRGQEPRTPVLFEHFKASGYLYLAELMKSVTKKHLS